LAERRIHGLVVLIRRLALQHAARPEFLPKSRILGVVWVFRLLLGIQVIEVPEELVEAMDRRQMLVAVTQVVLAELARGVAQGLHDVGDTRIFRPQPQLRAGQTRPWSVRCGSATAR